MSILLHMYGARVYMFTGQNLLVVAQEIVCIQGMKVVMPIAH